MPCCCETLGQDFQRVVLRLSFLLKRVGTVFGFCIKLWINWPPNGQKILFIDRVQTGVFMLWHLRLYL